MKLSMSLIAKYLDKYQPECHIQQDSLTIKGVRFLSASDVHFSLDYIYLGEAEGFYQDPRYAGAILLANGTNQILCRGADYEDLLNDVLSAFDYYNEFEQKLRLAASGHAPLEDMMVLIRDILDCPFLVLDISGNLLSSTHVDSIPVPFILNNIRSTNQIGSNALGGIVTDQDGNISHDLSDRPQYLLMSGYPDHLGCIGMYLMQHGEKIGFVLIFPLEKAQIDLGLCLEALFAECCVNAFEFTNRSSMNQSNHSILLEMLNGNIPIPAVLKKFITTIPLRRAPVLVLFQSVAVRNTTLHRMLIAEIDQQHIPCIACEHGNLVAVLTDTDTLERVLQLFSQRISSNSLLVGISMPIPDMQLFAAAYQQAYYALNASPDPGIRYCKDLALSYLIQALRDNKMSMYLLHPVLASLQEYDRNNNTELYDTLRAYLRTGGSQTDAASELHVHLNTLKYRLGRIRDLTHLDFQDHTEMFYVRLSLEVYENETGRKS